MGLQLRLCVYWYSGSNGVRSAPGHPLSSREEEDKVFGVLKTARGLVYRCIQNTLHLFLVFLHRRGTGNY